MEFLVTIKVSRVSVGEAEEADLRARERAIGERYLDNGALRRIWRLPGRRASLSLWNVADADELHDLLAGFPLFPWMDIDVTPLARHYLDAGDRSGGAQG